MSGPQTSTSRPCNAQASVAGSSRRRASSTAVEAESRPMSRRTRAGRAASLAGRRRSRRRPPAPPRAAARSRASSAGSGDEAAAKAERGAGQLLGHAAAARDVRRPDERLLRRDHVVGARLGAGEPEQQLAANQRVRAGLGARVPSPPSRTGAPPPRMRARPPRARPPAPHSRPPWRPSRPGAARKKWCASSARWRSSSGRVDRLERFGHSAVKAHAVVRAKARRRALRGRARVRTGSGRERREAGQGFGSEGLPEQVREPLRIDVAGACEHVAPNSRPTTDATASTRLQPSESRPRRCATTARTPCGIASSRSSDASRRTSSATKNGWPSVRSWIAATSSSEAPRAPAASTSRATSSRPSPARATS